MTVYSDSVLDVAQNFNELLGLFPDFITVQAAFTAEMILNPSWAFIPVDDDERLAMLKKFTSLIYSIRPDFNCYPVGLTTTILFDINGDPVP